MQPIRILMVTAVIATLFAPRASFSQCPNPVAADFRNQILASGTGGVLQSPVEMAVTIDGRVFIAERFGRIRVYDPGTGTVSTAATLDTYTYPNSGSNDVGGPLGVAVGPNFASDNWLYVYYAPLSLFNGTANHSTGRLTYRLSRFQVQSGNVLNLASEQILLSVPSIWETHNGGSLKFGRNGDLYLSTGDNNAAGCSNQYSPMDERAGFEYCDDQRTTANTNSLNGKVLRIHPEPGLVNGLYYTIPAGNLFAPGTALTRPEIYTMGHRNPYRIFPDTVTGRLYIAEYGPAAPSLSNRGPAGADQIKATDAAAFMGYPYFLKDNQAYCHWDYAAGACMAITGQTSQYFDPATPRNYSRNNTGLNILPPARPSILWEHDGSSPDPVPGIKTCGFGVGPVYHYSAALNSTVKFPPFFNDKWILFATYGGWQPKLVTPPPGPVVAVTTSQVANVPWSFAFTQGLHDMEYGPGDGALYALDYGGTMYANNTDATLRRLTYVGCLPTPVLEKPRTALMARFGLSAFAGQTVEAPLGARSLEIFGVNGQKVMELELGKPASRSVVIPASLGTGLLWLRFR